MIGGWGSDLLDRLVSLRPMLWLEVAALSEGRHSVCGMSVTTTKLKDWSLAPDNIASPAQVVVTHRSVGIARLPYVTETKAVIAYLVQAGVPEATARALAVQFRTNFASPKVRLLARWN